MLFTANGLSAFLTLAGYTLAALLVLALLVCAVSAFLK